MDHIMSGTFVGRIDGQEVNSHWIVRIRDGVATWVINGVEGRSTSDPEAVARARSFVRAMAGIVETEVEIEHPFKGTDTLRSEPDTFHAAD